MTKKEITTSYTQSLPIDSFTESSRIMIKDFICPLCNGVYFNPVIDTCAHIFCLTCFNAFNPSLLQCPITAQPLSMQPKPIQSISDFINTQLIYCKNKAKGCQWTGPVTDHLNHLNNQCGKELRTCPIQCCSIQIPYEDYDDHVAHCIALHCEYCGIEVSKAKIELHYESCPKLKVKCPNKCNVDVQRDLIEEHMLRDCLNAQVDCIYYPIGCNCILFRKEVLSHNETEQISHLDLIANWVGSNKEGIKERMMVISKEIEALDDMYNAEDIEMSHRRIGVSYQEEVSLLGRKRIQSQANTDKTPIPSMLFDIQNSSPGVKFNDNRVYCNTTPTEHMFAFCAFDISKCQWSIRLIKYSQWIGIGVCDKRKVLENNRRLYSMQKRFNHGSFLMSTNGYIWNCNNEEENNKQIPIATIKKGDEVHFAYNANTHELQFTHKDYTSKFTKVIGNNLVCCIVFLNYDNEVEVKVNKQSQ